MDHSYIRTWDGKNYQLTPLPTHCELFTGLKDCKYHDLIEGDIVKDKEGKAYEVVMVNGSFIKRELEGLHKPIEIFTFEDEKVGNIHEEPYKL